MEMDGGEFRNTLSIGSGGIKGFSYLGVCKFLEKQRILETVGVYVGCSVGSLICLSLICGTVVSDLLKEFLTKGFDELIEPSSIEDMISGVGLFDKRMLKEYVIKFVERQLNITDVETLTFKQLKELTGKDLYTITANIDTYELKVYGTIPTPDESCVEAVVASCSIPFVFQGTEIPEGFLVDGALMDPVGLRVAFQYSQPGARIFSSFFSFKPTSMSILRSLQGTLFKESIMGEFWDKADQSYPQPLDHNRASNSGIVTNILSHGQRLYRSFMESLVENYVYRHIYENQLNDVPFLLHLFPMPNFNAGLHSTAESKVQMYFTGLDLAQKIGQGYGFVKEG
jgi:predicted acylesterase/phospholipase RssA